MLSNDRNPQRNRSAGDDFLYAFNRLLIFGILGAIVEHICDGLDIGHPTRRSTYGYLFSAAVIVLSEMAAARAFNQREERRLNRFRLFEERMPGLITETTNPFVEELKEKGSVLAA